MACRAHSMWGPALQMLAGSVGLTWPFAQEAAGPAQDATQERRAWLPPGSEIARVGWPLRDDGARSSCRWRLPAGPKASRVSGGRATLSCVRRQAARIWEILPPCAGSLAYGFGEKLARLSIKHSGKPAYVCVWSRAGG